MRRWYPTPPGSAASQIRLRVGDGDSQIDAVPGGIHRCGHRGHRVAARRIRFCCGRRGCCRTCDLLCVGPLSQLLAQGSFPSPIWASRLSGPVGHVLARRGKRVLLLPLLPRIRLAMVVGTKHWNCWDSKCAGRRPRLSDFEISPINRDVILQTRVGIHLSAQWLQTRRHDQGGQVGT